MAWSPEGRTVLTGSSNAKLWDPSTGDSRGEGSTSKEVSSPQWPSAQVGGSS